MFSSRTNWNFLPNRLTQLLEQKHKRNDPIVDLTESNPTKCGFRYDSSGLLATIADERSLRYDPDPKGLLAAREAVCEFYLRKNFRLDPEHVILTASTSEAYSFLLRLLCNPGDSVLVPQPSYPLFDDLCQLNDVEMTPYRLSYDGEWHIDAASLGTAVSKALILVHPNNPTGSFVKLEEEKLIVDVAQKKNLAIIADEVFSEYGFGANHHRVETFAYTDVVLTFTLGGISKLLGLPQMKLAWIVVSGPDQLRTEALKRLEFISDTY
ncbi:MAG: pyridoxal phosphate-dependent aminotransferase, partial [Ignavibacteriales bacterium]|nr:pyridoxal phosphate-dependent aminotransferase [Ignavibacteriales bacterium]